MIRADRLAAALEPYRSVLREHALEIDADPARGAEFFTSGAFPFHRFAGLPPQYNDDPLRVDGVDHYLTGCEERVIATEVLARGDASMVVGAPGASMSGVLVDALASPEQLDRYYRVVADGPAWTFFALTEPAHGSDASALETRVEGDGSGAGALHGTKRYIGNGARAAIGVVFARIKPGPVGIGALLVDTSRPGYRATPIDALGMRGVQLSEIEFDGLATERADLLGEHLTASRRGILGAVRVFDKLRPVVGALALGIAGAAHEYLRTERRAPSVDERHLLDRFDARIRATRAVIREAARLADAERPDGARSAAAKAMAVALAEDVTRAAPELLGPGCRFEHPYLDKLVRDARGLELMEGTSTIQRLGVAAGYVQRAPKPAASLAAALAG